MTIVTDITDLASTLLEPTPLAILLSVILVVTLPILLHLLLTTSASAHTLPTILLLGPSNSGKTSLLTLFETSHHRPTRPTLTPLTVECSLPLSTKPASSQYRSSADPTTTSHKKFLLADTPGHAKLRPQAISSLTTSPNKSNIKGIIFTIDASALSSESETLRETATYLHDILLLLQHQHEHSKSSGGSSGRTKVLIASNKTDLFTALPPRLVQSTLESEITKVRESLQKGLLESGVEDAVAEERGWLGELSSTGEKGVGFRFRELEEGGMEVVVKGGSVTGGEVVEWWEWIGSCL